MKFKNNNNWINLSYLDLNNFPPINSQFENGMLPPTNKPNQMWITDQKGNPAWRSGQIYKHTLGSGSYLYRWGNIVHFILFEYYPTQKWTISDGRFFTELYIPYGFRPNNATWGILPVFGNQKQNYRFEIVGVSEDSIDPTQVTFMADSGTISTNQHVHISMCWFTNDPFPTQ